MNTVKLIGNVGREVNTKVFTNGNITSFSLATNERYTNRNQEEVTSTTWHNIVAFGKLSTVCQKMASKGKLLSIEGKIQYRTYQNKNNETVSVAEVVVYKVEEMKQVQK